MWEIKAKAKKFNLLAKFVVYCRHIIFHKSYKAKNQHSTIVFNFIQKKRYKEEHEKEDIGHSAELKDSVQITQDKLTTALQSNVS